ncbi:MAG: VCBS repeat-containing protein [Pyrinomonadaceae bacterium]
MSKKRNGQKARSVLSVADDRRNDSPQAFETETNWWRGLSRNGRWLVVGVIAFLSIGALGAGLKYLEEEARVSSPHVSKGLLYSVNPFVTAPPPPPTPQLSKEYIHLPGGRLLAVEDANANVAPPADLAIWRPTTGQWWVMGGPGSSQTTASWGANGDTPVPGDYDGDGKTDFSIFRPSNSQWYIVLSSNNVISNYTFGVSGDKPAQADYDGDGRTDAAVFRPSNNNWYVLGSTNGFYYSTWGQTNDVPVSADFDGDGRADIAVWRGSNKTFYSVNSSNGNIQTIPFSQSSTQPVCGDYDGDGKADFAIKSGNSWIIRNSATPATPVTIPWQLASDTPVPNDYDGDGKVDIAVWRPTDSPAGTLGNWFIRQSASGGSLRQQAWGTTDDIPVPAFYRR